MAIFFKPWIGQNYFTDGFAGKKLLVLGESHYCASPSDATPTLTIDIIKDLLDPKSPCEPYKNTYTKFIESLLGRRGISLEDKISVWNSIAFYNYVQVPMSKARVAPSTDDFHSSEDAFMEIIETLRPDIIIVWGKRLYNNLPKGGFQGVDIKAPDGKWIETWNYSISGDHTVKILPVTHPSAGFTPEYWYEVIINLL